MTHAERVGTAVLAGLAKGLQHAIAAAQARSRHRAEQILAKASMDMLRGKPARGRAGRITRLLNRNGDQISERQVKRILDMLFSMSKLPVYPAPQKQEAPRHDEA